MKKEKIIKEIQERVDGYVEAVQTGARLAGELEKLAIQRYLDDLATGHKRPIEERIYFDTDSAAKAVNFFSYLRFFEGSLAGQPFVLPPWQAFIIWNIFGWKSHATEKRRFTEAYIEIAKKNGKSTFAAGIQLMMLITDNEPGAQIFSAAATRYQASIVLRAAIEIAKKSPKILERVKIWTNSIVVESSASFIQAVSSEANNVEGKHAHCSIIDEYHVHKTSDVKDNLRSGMGSRSQPLEFVITTAGYNKLGPCYRKRGVCVKILKRQLIDESQFVMIYTTDEGDEWDNPEVWEKSNPNLGINPNIKFLKDELKKAQNEGGEKEVSFKTKHLNMWVDAAKVWIQDAIWMLGNQGPLPMDELATAEAFAGLDLASVRDITSYVLTFKFPETTYILPFFWMPELNYQERVKKDGVNYDIWIKAGLMRVTPGNAIDIEYIKRDILQINQDFNIKKTAYDRWGSAALIAALVEEGLNIEEFGQGYGSMSAPTKKMEAMALRGEFSHAGNPILRWMCSNIMISTNPAGDIKIDKSKCAEKVDGMVALVMALGVSEQPEDDEGSVDVW